MMPRGVRRQAPVLVLLAAMVLSACSPSPDETAIGLCEQVPAGWAEIDRIYGEVPDTTDFDRIAPVLMEISTATRFLTDWSHISTDELNEPVRSAARRALAVTGTYDDGTNPITGAELTSNLRFAASAWGALAVSCGEIVEMDCLPLQRMSDPPVVESRRAAFC